MSTTQFMPGGTIHLHRHDLPEGLTLGPVVAVDTETMGLTRIATGSAWCSSPPATATLTWCRSSRRRSAAAATTAPTCSRLLADPATVKLMHFARFDVAMLQHALGITVAPVRCTKIAARLTRTFTDRHGLKDLCRDFSASSCPSSSRPPTGAQWN